MNGNVKAEPSGAEGFLSRIHDIRGEHRATPQTASAKVFQKTAGCFTAWYTENEFVLFSRPRFGPYPRIKEGMS
jgi:hypothetical protein